MGTSTNPVTLLVFLERPHTAYDGEARIEDVVMAGLTSCMDYWVDLALGWLEQGAPIDSAILRQLEAMDKTLHRSSQRLRHRSAALAQKWRHLSSP